jgi:hypothetical protein
MLYETLSQSIIVLGMLYFGIIGGVLFEVKDIISKALKAKSKINIVLDIIFCFLLCLLFWFAVNFTNYGEIRLYIVFSFFTGFVIERISVGATLAKIISFLYNVTVKFIKKINLPKVFKSKKEKVNEAINTKISN